MAAGTFAGVASGRLSTVDGSTGADCKKQPGKFRELGIPCLRDGVAKASAMLVLSPIFKADLQPEQSTYRAHRSANEAVEQIHQLVSRGYHEFVDGDLSNYFGEFCACRPDGEPAQPSFNWLVELLSMVVRSVSPIVRLSDTRVDGCESGCV